MKKIWNKISNSIYEFTIDGNEKAKLEIFPNTLESKATCEIQKQVFEIKRIGFWKSALTITDGDNQEVLKVYPEKWYANSSIVEFEGKQLKLKVRNNPLAEYVICDNDQEILAYGLDTANNELKVRITGSGDNHLLLDCLLWYLFAPVANEHFGDTYTFMYLLGI